MSGLGGRVRVKVRARVRNTFGRKQGMEVACAHDENLLEKINVLKSKMLACLVSCCREWWSTVLASRPGLTLTITLTIKLTLTLSVAVGSDGGPRLR